MAHEQRTVSIQADPVTLKGVFANTMMVTHTREEFVLDFLSIFPVQQQGSLVARVVTSPGHLKRIIIALQENLKKYEYAHGTVEASSEPVPEIGFHT